jgi:hypothetical protein
MDVAAIFLRDVRQGALPLRGRVKRETQDCLRAFSAGLEETFPESAGKPFANALPKLWVRWLASTAHAGDPLAFSLETGRRTGEELKREYAEGWNGGLAAFLLDRRLHLDGIRELLDMRGWLLATIERLKRDADPKARERAEILSANFASIVLRAQHGGNASYAAAAVERLASITGDLDRAIANLSSVEPEASRYLRNNRATIITRALHSGMFDYGERVAETLPSVLKDLNCANKRTVVYRALTNGRLDLLFREKK